MSTPTFLTMSWAERLVIVVDNFRRMIRTGAQTVLTGLALSDAGPVNGYSIDYKLGAGFFLGGCVVWLLTTLAAPPKD